MTETVIGLTSQELRDVADDARLRELAEAPVFTVFQRVASSPRGLTEPEAADRLRRFGDNAPFHASGEGLGVRIVAGLRSPFVALLAGMGVVFVVVGDARGAVTVAVMVTLAVVLRIWQQPRSVRATRALRDLVTSTVTVRRGAGVDQTPLDREVSLQDVVPGDVVMLRAGDVVPADLRIVSSSDLVVDQSVLSGESLPASKRSVARGKGQRGLVRDSVVDTPSLCFSGTAVVAGTATAVVIATGDHTYFGSLARAARDLRPQSCFDR